MDQQKRATFSEIFLALSEISVYPQKGGIFIFLFFLIKGHRHVSYNSIN